MNDYVMVIRDVTGELVEAEKEHPDWPEDPIHATAIIGEEAGEALRAAIDFYYHRGTLDQIRREVAQTAAVCIRFLLETHYRQEER